MPRERERKRERGLIQLFSAGHASAPRREGLYSSPFNFARRGVRRGEIYIARAGTGGQRRRVNQSPEGRGEKGETTDLMIGRSSGFLLRNYDVV